MKALTLWRPWPWAIFHATTNPKRIENRPWKPWPSIIGQQIVLHAGKTFDKGAVDDILELTRPEDECDLRQVLPASATDLGLIGVAHVAGYCEDESQVFAWDPAQIDWWSGPFAWKLANVRAFKEPIACDGRQGLWDLPRWAEKLVLEALR